MALSRRELLGYAIAGTTGMGITATGRTFGGDPSESRGASAVDSRGSPGRGQLAGGQASDEQASSDRADVGQYWRLGGVQARPAEIHDTAVTFRAAAGSNYDTDYEVAVRLFYRTKGDGSRAAESGYAAKQVGSGRWQKLADGTAPLSEGVYLEATATGLEAGTTYQYAADASLTNHEGPSRRVSEVQEVTAGQPCSGPSTNCLRVSTLAPRVRASGVTLRGKARGLASYDEVTGHFFYRREGDEKRWTEYVPVTGGGSGTYSTTLSGLASGTYTYYAEVRGEGGEMKNMYAEGETRRFAVE